MTAFPVPPTSNTNSTRLIYVSPENTNKLEFVDVTKKLLVFFLRFVRYAVDWVGKCSCKVIQASNLSYLKVQLRTFI